MSRTISRQQDATDLKVIFIPPKGDLNKYRVSLATELENQGVTVLDTSWHSYFPLLVPIWSKGRPDVIHIHWLHGLITGSTGVRTLVKSFRLIFELIIAKFLGISIVWTVHNLTSHDPDYPRWELLWRTILPRVFFDHLIVHCELAKDIVRETYHLQSTPISVIPHGHYIDGYPRNITREDARRSFGIEKNDVVFAFFGQIRPYKQIPYLIDTFKQLDERGAQLIVAGNPSTETLQQRVTARGERHGDIILKLEFIPDEQVSRYFKAADVVVLPYRDILTSGSAILAMSFARPVIAPRLGCLPELIKDGVNGILYDPSNQRRLKQAMERACESDLDEMGQRACETVEEFKWSLIAEQTRKVYES